MHQQPRPPQLLLHLDPAFAPCWFTIWSFYAEGEETLEKVADNSRLYSPVAAIYLWSIGKLPFLALDLCSENRAWGNRRWLEFWSSVRDSVFKLQGRKIPPLPGLSFCCSPSLRLLAIILIFFFPFIIIMNCIWVPMSCKDIKDQKHEVICSQPCNIQVNVWNLLEDNFIWHKISIISLHPTL